MGDGDHTIEVVVRAAVSDGRSLPQLFPWAIM